MSAWSCEEMTLVIQHAPFGVVKADLSGRFLCANPKFEEITGYTEPELQGMSWQDITPPYDRKTDSDLVAQIVSGERKEFVLDKAYNRKRNGVARVRLYVRGIYNETGELEAFMGIAHALESRSRSASAGTAEKGRSALRTLIAENWKWGLTTIVTASLFISGWVVSVQTAVNQVKQNTARLDRLEGTMTEVVRELQKIRVILQDQREG